MEKGMNSFFAPKEFVLPNKLQVVFQYVPNIKLVSINCWIKTGSVNETDITSGISHFLEHMLFNGTKNFKSGEIDKFLDSKGGMNNAFTSRDLTSYYVTIPTLEAEAGFYVISDMVFNALLEEKEVESERPAVLQELKRQFDSPIYDMVKDFHSSIYKGTPYSKEIIGTEESINSFNSENLKEYYNKFYHPENMILVITGDIAFNEVEELSLKYFNQYRSVEKGEFYDELRKVEIENKGEKRFKSAINTEYVIISYPLPEFKNESIYSFEMFDNILSSGEYSLLNEIIKNEKGIAISVDSMTDFYKYNGCFAVFGVVENGMAETFRAEVVKVLEDVASGKLDEKRVQRAKNRMKSVQIFERENISSLGEEIGYAYSLGFKEYYLNFKEKIESVTKDDIINAAAYILKEKPYFAITSA